jgi:hypothetical protein
LYSWFFTPIRPNGGPRPADHLISEIEPLEFVIQFLNDPIQLNETSDSSEKKKPKSHTKREPVNVPFSNAIDECCWS